ncbi:MAG: hypothetical protein PHQ96_09870 [Candidatus Omnitrophica bacterium]|nr:hypothetical protein [Candidatus Omnitrophota bacterium]
MRSLVIYYSHRGNTAYVARAFFEALKKKGDTDIFELKYIGGEGLFTRILCRLMPSRTQLATIPLDLGGYDLLCLGIPVIGGFPSSAITKYIQTFSNINGKKIICCYIYGVEASAEHCSHYIEKLVRNKGNPEIINVFVPWYDVLKENFLENIISKTILKVA